MHIVIFLSFFLCSMILRNEAMQKPIYIDQPKNVTLPSPRGPHPVGFASYHFKDTARKEHHSKNTNDIRELMVQFWYPAQKDSHGKQLAYLNDILYPFKEDISKKLGKPISHFDYLNTIKTHAIIDAPLATDKQKFPVLIFSHGWQFTSYNYEILLSELASFGYIVVAINHPYAATMVIFDDTRHIPIQADLRSKLEVDQGAQICELATWVADIKFVVDELEKINTNPKSLFFGHLDLQRLGVIGHSYGAAASLYFCNTDKRCKAGIALDGGLLFPDFNLRIPAPFLFMNANGNPSKLKELTEKLILGNEHAHLLTLDANHNSYSDSDIVFPKMNVPNPLKTLHLILDYVVNFFDKEIKK